MAKIQAKSKKGAKASSKPKAKSARPHPAAKSAAKRVAKPAAKAAAKTIAKPVAKPMVKPAAKSVAKPAAKRPAAKAVVTRTVPKISPKPMVPQPAASKPAPRPVVPKPVVVKPAPPALPPRPVLPKAAKPAVVKVAPMKPTPVVKPVLPSPKEYAEMRARLETKRKEILESYKRDLRVGQEANDEPTEDIVDRANNAYHRELMFSLSDSERQLLLQVEAALSRFELGTFGACVHCGDAIALPRLQAIPWARLCINCQELAEKGLLDDN